MKNIQRLIESITSFTPKALNVAKDAAQYSCIEITNNNTEFMPGTVYIGKQSQIQNVLRYLNGIIFFLIEDMNDFYMPNLKNTIIQFSNETNMNDLFEICNSINIEKDLLLENSYQLFQSFLLNNDLSSIIETSSKLIKNPLIVIDISYKILAYSKSYEVKDEQWQRNINRGYCSYEYVAGFNEIEGVKRSPKSNLPFSIHCHTSPLRRCISKLYVNNKQVGYLISIEAFSSFDDMDMDLFINMSNLIAKTVYTNSQISKNVPTTFFDSVFIDVLDNTLQNSDVLYERMQQMDFNIHSEYRILVIDISKYGNYDYNSEHLKQFITSILPYSKNICYQNDVVVLLDEKRSIIPILDILNKNSDFLIKNNLRIGVSDSFTNLMEIPNYYAQSKEALDIALKLELNEVISCYDDLKFFSLLIHGNVENYSNYFSKEFKKILRYDAENDTEYIRTIFEYIRLNKKIDLVASRMFIHKNTVSYRINRSKELFDFDFQNYEMCSRFYSSFLIHATILKNIVK